MPQSSWEATCAPNHSTVSAPVAVKVSVTVAVVSPAYEVGMTIDAPVIVPPYMVKFWPPLCGVVVGMG